MSTLCAPISAALSEQVVQDVMAAALPEDSNPDGAPQQSILAASSFLNDEDYEFPAFRHCEPKLDWGPVEPVTFNLTSHLEKHGGALHPFTEE